METNEEIEMLLWEYMDGTCSEADMHRISVLIARDDAWKQKYDELHALHISMVNGLQSDEPSMRFTKNVMDAVAQAHIAPATKQYINKGIIRGIAVFFILTITTLFVYALANASSGAASANMLPKFDLSKLSMDRVFNSSAFIAILTVNVVLGLVLLDSLLRRKRTARHVHP